MASPKAPLRAEPAPSGSPQPQGAALEALAGGEAGPSGSSASPPASAAGPGGAHGGWHHGQGHPHGVREGHHHRHHVRPGEEPPVEAAGGASHHPALPASQAKNPPGGSPGRRASGARGYHGATAPLASAVPLAGHLDCVEVQSRRRERPPGRAPGAAHASGARGSHRTAGGRRGEDRPWRTSNDSHPSCRLNPGGASDPRQGVAPAAPRHRCRLPCLESRPPPAGPVAPDLAASDARPAPPPSQAPRAS